MNKKSIIIILAAAVIIIAGTGVYFLTQREAADGDIKISGNSYIGVDFTITPPDGWVQTRILSALVSYQNPKESYPPGSAADKVHFQSYIAVSFDNTNGQTLDQIEKLVEQQIKSVVPSISFISVADGFIDGQPAKFIEADLFMQDINFKVMMAIVLKGDKYFTISNNTTLEKWPGYHELFYAVANSFKFKY